MACLRSPVVSQLPVACARSAILLNGSDPVALRRKKGGGVEKVFSHVQEEARLPLR